MSAGARMHPDDLERLAELTAERLATDTRSQPASPALLDASAAAGGGVAAASEHGGDGLARRRAPRLSRGRRQLPEAPEATRAQAVDIGLRRIDAGRAPGAVFRQPVDELDHARAGNGLRRDVG